MTLSGRNGAGKTTLLRMLAGEASIDVGELVLAKGAKVALHDQRPPRERRYRCATTCCPGRGSWSRSNRSWRRSRRRWRAARTTSPRSTATRRRRPGSSTPADTAGARPPCPTLHGLGFRDDADLDRELRTFSGGELTRASLGRALAGAPDLLLLDEPTNHLDIDSLEWLEQHLVALDAAVVLVAHDRWFLEAVGTSVLELEGGRGRFFPGPWHAWRPRAGGARAGARPCDRAPAGRDRPPRAVRDPVPGRDPRAPGAVAGQAAVEDGADRARSGRRSGARVRVQAARAQRPRRVRADRRADRGRESGCCSTTRSCGSSAASTCRWSGLTAPARRR